MPNHGSGSRGSSGAHPGKPQRPSGGQPNDLSDDGSNALLRALIGVLFGAMISCATFAWPWMRYALAVLFAGFTVLCMITAWRHRQSASSELRKLVQSFSK